MTERERERENEKGERAASKSIKNCQAAKINALTTRKLSYEHGDYTAKRQRRKSE